MKITMVAIVTVISGFVCFGTNATGEPHRQALVIGNDSYPGHELNNARNDAKALASTLGDLGYVVTLRLDLDRKSLGESIADFANSVSASDLVLLYYSGHGMQVDGENYLIPIDFKASSPVDAKSQGYALSSYFNKIKGRGVRTEVIILDACRDNPFFVTRSLNEGWAEPPQNSSGAYISFGTAPGSTAADGPKQSHGLFTNVLLKYLALPELDINQLFTEVRKEVVRQSSGLQVPWDSSSLTGTLHLNPQFDELSSTRTLTGEGRSTAIQSPASPTSGSQSSSASVEILINQGLLLAQNQNYEEAIRSLSGALAADPRSWTALRILGLLFKLTGRAGDAITALTRAITVNPSDPSAYYERCLAAGSSDPSSAIADCNAALGLDATFIAPHLGLANALLLDNQPNKAYQEASKFLSLSPNSGIGYALRGKISTALGDYSGAQQDFQSAVRASAANQN